MFPPCFIRLLQLQMVLSSHRIMGVAIALVSFTLSAAALGPPATNGTVDPAVLSSIVPPTDWDPAAAVLEVPGPSRGRYKRDGTLVAVTASIPRTSSSSDPNGPRTASVMTQDRINNNVCIVQLSTGNEITCKTSPNGRFRLCLQRGEWVTLGQLAVACCYLVLLAVQLSCRPSHFVLRVCVHPADQIADQIAEPKHVYNHTLSAGTVESCHYAFDQTDMLVQ